MTDWVDKEVKRLLKKGKKMSKIEFLRLIFITAYSGGRDELKEKVEEMIDKNKIKGSPFGLKYVDGWNDGLETIKQKLKGGKLRWLGQMHLL